MWREAMVKVYKLVRRAPDGKLLSAYMDVPELQVEYRPGEWVEAKVGYLFSFRDSENVLVEETFELWEAEAEGIHHPTPQWIPSLSCGDEKRFLRFWESNDMMFRECLMMVWMSRWLPDGWELAIPGTVLSRRLRLVRKVGR
jgi:hypothetical protein